jgi:DNA ligase-1
MVAFIQPKPKNKYMNHTIDYSDEKFKGLKLAADWIRDLESSDSRIHKEKVIEKALMASKLGSASAQCFLFNCYQAYNPFYVFGVRQVPETMGLVDRPNPWPSFWGLLEALRLRTVTGNTARDSIELMSQEFDSEEWNGLCRRVIIKDLRCGISEKTLNKVLGKSEWKIPIFSCQLAQDSNDHPAKLKGTKRLEVKLDGVRVITVVTGDGVNLFSRNGKPFENFPQIADALTSILEKLPSVNLGGRGYIFDGEIVGESFQQLMRQAHRKGNAKTEGMVYHVFDIVPLPYFREGKWDKVQTVRLTHLEQFKSQFETTDCIRIMPGMNVDLNTAEGHDVMRRFAEASVEQGYEGIMIKDIDAPYECKRSSAWMKWKPTITVDLNIVGFEEGTGRNVGRLGAIICEGVDNDRTIRVNVGSGLSDSNRDEYWAARDELLDRVVEVEADAVTQNQDGSYSLRFPRFVRFRGFEAGEKL